MLRFRSNHSAAEKSVVLKSSRYETAASIGSWIGPSVIESQSSLPTDNTLIEKLGIASSDRLHFFAAASGDWARALAHKCTVHASDASERQADFLRKNMGNLRSVTKIAAEIAMLRNHGRFDWLVSYEPYPITDRVYSFECVMRNALLNRKGLKMVFSLEQNSLQQEHGIPLRMAAFAKLYGAKIKTDNVSIGTSSGPQDFRVYTLHTNEKARQLAHVDLFTDSRMRGGTNTDVVARAISERFGISRGEAESSMRRVIKSRRTGMLTFG